MNKSSDQYTNHELGDVYFAQHTISTEFAVQQGITWDEKEVHIPVRDEEGNVIFSKHRNLHFTPHDTNSPPKYRYDAGSKAALFNFHAVKAKAYIVISEGEVDCLKLSQEDIPSVSSTGGANTFLPEWAELLKDKSVFICLDNDKAGRDGTAKITALLPDAKIVQLPENNKDICEYFADNHSKEDFIALLQEALTIPEWLQKNEPPDFKWVSAEELVAKEFPEEQWLIDKILYMEGFCFIYGAEGVGKSFITLSMAQAIATGTPWLGHFRVPRPGRVLFIDKENPLPILAKRLNGMKITGENIFWLERPELLALVNIKGELTDFFKSLSQKVQNEKIDLIIVDSFVDLMVGSENSAEDTQGFFETMRTNFPHKTILLIHHESKPIQGAFRTDAQRTRGSTNINAQAITQFRLESVAKSKTDLTLKQTKARNSEKLDKFVMKMVVEQIDENNSQITGFEYLGEVVGDESKFEETKQMILDLFADKIVVSRVEVDQHCEANNISPRTIASVIKEMIDKKELLEFPNEQDRRKRDYSLPDNEES